MTIALNRSVLIGLIGHGVGPSLTPPMHELEGARHGLRYLYRPIEFTAADRPREHLGQLIRSAQSFGFDGLNLTFPVKQTVVPLLDELSATARMVGAVNTVTWKDERLLGHNTDVSGFRASLADALGEEPHGRIVLLGAGGAGSAVSHALAMQGLERLTIVDVDFHRAALLADDITAVHRQSVEACPLEALPALLERADGLVNATPIGMAHHPGSAVDAHLLQPHMWVCDVVYRPVDTELLRSARSRGCRTISGLGMAMHQAADAFEIFTGETADRSAMLTDLHNLVSAENQPSVAP